MSTLDTDMCTCRDDATDPDCFIDHAEAREAGAWSRAVDRAMREDGYL